MYHNINIFYKISQRYFSGNEKDSYLGAEGVLYFLCPKISDVLGLS